MNALYSINLMKSSEIDHHSIWHMMKNTNTYAVQGSEGTFCHQVYVWKFMKAAKKQDYVTTDDVYLWPDLAFCHSCAARDKANIKNSERNEKIYRKLPFFLWSHTNIYCLCCIFGVLVTQHTKENFRIRNVQQDWHCLLWLRLHGNLLCGCD